MPKLTETHLVILAAAAQRPSGLLLPLPKSLRIRGGAVTAVLRSLLKSGLAVEQSAALDIPAWGEGEDGGRLTLAITPAGLQAISADHASTPAPQADTPRPIPPRRKPAAKPGSTMTRRESGSPAAARMGTKQAVLIGLLRRRKGMTIAEAVAATGWQPHSVRGALSGTLRKKLGLAIASEPVDGRGRVYRIANGG